MKNSTKGIIIAGVIIIILFISQLYNEKLNQNKDILEMETRSQEIESKEISYVPKGYFVNTENGQKFEYIDSAGYLVSCGLKECKSVYFDLDQDGKIIQIRNSDENPIIGKVTSVSIDETNREVAVYSVKYDSDGKSFETKYTDNLCTYHKGGGSTCLSPARVDQTVIVVPSDLSTSSIEYLIRFNRILKADVVDVVNVDHRELEKLAE